MAAILIRPVQTEDLEGYYDVRALTYNDGNPIPEERRGFKYSRAYAALVQGHVEGCFTLYDLTCTRGAATLDCAGIASVAVYPHRRRSGIGTSMMSWIPRHLRELETPIASLYAYREPFYRRFGFEVAGKRLKITCPTHRLPKTSSRLEVRRLTPADWREVDSCYSNFAHSRSGLCLRTELLWGRVLGENRALTIYAAGDPVEAYAVVSHSTAFWSTDHISDVAWCSSAGYDALMDVLAGIGINKTALSWFEPSDSPFYGRYLDQGVEVKVDRPIMFRVCDVPRALRMIRCGSSGSFTVRVIDELVPENEGPWRVEFSSGEVSVKSTDFADFVLDVRAFTQAFLGEPSLIDLARLGLVEVANANGFKAACEFLPPSPVICNDFF